ncbi:hypothetical protein LZ198_33100 [Myxococcus sp. K15C18031901]|uniref:hypothetical protein n=1 Tax=Myxococcus dinghuensis TaxID=2906761 RepID=UPI0020A71D2B|nr:hypothetical protein [Myxococcus dinghuensis]MCP3103732.1 hypothetical protein [Myxococcus dinghuensis]
MTTINYIWLGERSLGALELFNIYTWKLVGCDVAIYAFHWTNGRAHDARSLGLAPDDDVAVHDMHALVADDDSVQDENDPRRYCPEMREVLSSWYNRVWSAGLDGDEDKRRDQIFNMVDLTKSYIGATRLGIVLDFKVGPSPHFKAYEDAFSKKFISYTRGSLMVGGSGGAPENQCIGTMQAENTIRCDYAKLFSAKFKLGVEDFKKGFNQKKYDLFTTYHARSFTQLKKAALNVTLSGPDGTPISAMYSVDEIDDEKSRGPFRVFKRAGDQTNQSGGVKTTPSEVKALARQVLDHETVDYEGAYLGKLSQAWAAMPG